MLLEARGDATEVFDLVDQTLNQISEAIKLGTAIVTSVRQQNLAGSNALQHVGRAWSVVGLAFVQLQPYRIAVGVDHRMNFGRQSAARAPHAAGCSDVARRGDAGGLRPLF